MRILDNSLKTCKSFAINSECIQDRRFNASKITKKLLFHHNFLFWYKGKIQLQKLDILHVYCSSSRTDSEPPKLLKGTGIIRARRICRLISSWKANICTIYHHVLLKMWSEKNKSVRFPPKSIEANASISKATLKEIMVITINCSMQNFPHIVI